jgi:glycosyltransferase involved in cell wall biosynthesis
MFSFMTPAYNAARYLPETIDSILKQTYPEWEAIVVVDEASTDNTLEVANRYAAQDARIRVFTLPHCNVAEKMNFALQQMRYNWVCGIDADDLAAPERLALVKAAIEARPDVIAWGGKADYFNDHGKVLYVSQLGPATDEEFHAMRQRNEPIMLNHCAMSFRRDIALELGSYDLRLYTCDDIDLCDRLSDKGMMLSLPHLLAKYRIHTTSQTASQYAKHAYQMRFIWERRKQQNAGKTLTWDEYQQMQGTLPPSRYFQQWAIDYARLHWRQAGVAWGEKNFPSLVKNLALSTLMNPAFVARKVTGQIAMRTGRKLRRAADKVTPSDTPSVEDERKKRPI